MLVPYAGCCYVRFLSPSTCMLTYFSFLCHMCVISAPRNLTLKLICAQEWSSGILMADAAAGAEWGGHATTYGT